MKKQKILACLVICLVLTVSAGIVMATTDISPPKSDLPDESNTFVRSDMSEDAITAVVVKSWGACSSISLIWDDLNANWVNYGETPIYIDYSYPGLCEGPITYDKLVSCGADVVIISDPAGGLQQYDSSEIDAIRRYAQDGHNVIGTYLLFQWGYIDNRGLADIFGLRSDLSYNTGVVPCSLTFNILEPDSPLFEGLTGTYDSTGFPHTQVPINDYSWDDDDLNDARFVAKNTDNKGAITVYDASTYSAIFVSVMPEYGGGVEDKQLFYNAITSVQISPWQEINAKLDALIANVSTASMPNIIKQRLLDKLEYAKALKENAHEECLAGNFDAATKKLGVAKNQVESFASMVKITRRISATDKASFLADAASIIEKIQALIEDIETGP